MRDRVLDLRCSGAGRELLRPPALRDDRDAVRAVHEPGLRSRWWRRTAPTRSNPNWGLHLVDANIALGNLVSIVGTEATAFAKRASGGRMG
jgi:hypothetical protein